MQQFCQPRKPDRADPPLAGEDPHVRAVELRAAHLHDQVELQGGVHEAGIGGRVDALATGAHAVRHRAAGPAGLRPVHVPAALAHRAGGEPVRLPGRRVRGGPVRIRRGGCPAHPDDTETSGPDRAPWASARPTPPPRSFGSASALRPAPASSPADRPCLRNVRARESGHLERLGGVGGHRPRRGLTRRAHRLRRLPGGPVRILPDRCAMRRRTLQHRAGQPGGEPLHG